MAAGRVVGSGAVHEAAPLRPKPHHCRTPGVDRNRKATRGGAGQRLQAMNLVDAPAARARRARNCDKCRSCRRGSRLCCNSVSAAHSTQQRYRGQPANAIAAGRSLFEKISANQGALAAALVELHQAAGRLRHVIARLDRPPTVFVLIPYRHGYIVAVGVGVAARETLRDEPSLAVLLVDRHGDA